jgi:metal-responsive CopG/Arc/MetJ family transcriptional regulator
MISIPDDLLARLDAQARASQETRSGFLQRLAERELKAGEVGRRKEIEELLGEANLRLGGRGTQLIREDRESH